MTSKLTRERIELIANFHRAMTLPPSHDEIEELARMALAAMDSEPVAIVEPSDYVTAAQLVGEGPARKAAHELYEGALRIGDKLYRHAQQAKGLELAGWQFKSVNGDWLGLIDEHGKNQAVREGCEVREVFAMADGVNDRDQVRREHAEWSQSTFGSVGPIGPLKHLSKEALEAAAEPGDLSEWADMQFLLWDAQRRAGITDEQITQAMIDKLAVNKQRSWPEPKDGEPRLHIKEQPALTGNSPLIGIDLASGPDRTVEVRYVAPPGYVMVPREPTDEMIAAAMNCEDVLFNSDDSFCVQFGNIYEAMLAAAPQEVKGE